MKGSTIMNFSFHYYGTYCAAVEAGFESDDAWVIAHAAQFVDDCSKTLLKEHGMAGRLPTCHKENELSQMNIGWSGAYFPDEIPKVWTAFHFLPGNYTEDGHYRLPYRNAKYIGDPAQTTLFKLMCLPYSYILGKIIDRAKQEYWSTSNTSGQKLCYIGIVMHALADTFAHEYFVGAPSEAINGLDHIIAFDKFSEVKPYGLSTIRTYNKKEISSLTKLNEPSSWLGHNRIGTYADIPNKKYYYNPSWYPDIECIKDNPLLYLCAFVQMTNAMKFICDTSDNNPFDYKKELTKDEYNSEYSSKLLKIFMSDGSETNQENEWSQHILNTYNQSSFKYDAKHLASTNTFLNDFIDNADKHRNMVCQYCRSITFPTLKYF